MRRQQIVLFVLFTIAYFLSYFFRSANAVIAGDLTRELSLTAADLGFMTSLFYACFAAAQLPLGIGLDRLGPRWVTAGLMLSAAIGSLIFAAAHTFPMLALGRALIGLGMAGVLMGAFKSFGQWFGTQRLATITGLLVGIGASGGLFAATPLAWLNQQLGWRSVFVAGAAIVVCSALSIMLLTRNAPPGVDWHGGALRGGLGDVFRDRRFWRIGLVNFWLIGTALAVQSLWGGPYLFDVIGLSPIAAGNVLLTLGLGVVTGYFICGWLADRWGAQRTTSIAVGVFVLAQIALLVPGSKPIGLLMVIFVAFGFASTFNIVLLAQIRALFSTQMSGRATTAGNMLGFVGVTLLQWGIGVVIGWWPQVAPGRYPPIAYTAAFSLTTLGTLLALLWYVRLGRDQRIGAGISAESIEARRHATRSEAEG